MNPKSTSDNSNQPERVYCSPASAGSDPRENPPTGFRYDCFVTPSINLLDEDTEVTWHNGLGQIVDARGCYLMPRDVDKDGTCYLFLPNKSLTVSPDAKRRAEGHESRLAQFADRRGNRAERSGVSVPSSARKRSEKRLSERRRRCVYAGLHTTELLNGNAVYCYKCGCRLRASAPIDGLEARREKA